MKNLISETTKKWDVSKEIIWLDCLGHTICDLKIYWEETWVENSETKIRNYFTYPQTLKLFFSNNEKIFISAAEFKHGNNKEALTGMDNLLVTSNDELAKQTKMFLMTAGEETYKRKSIWQRLFG